MPSAGPKVACPVISACGLDLSPQNFFTGPQTAAEPLSRRLGNAVYEQYVLNLECNPKRVAVLVPLSGSEAILGPVMHSIHLQMNEHDLYATALVDMRPTSIMQLPLDSLG